MFQSYLCFVCIKTFLVILQQHPCGCSGETYNQNTGQYQQGINPNSRIIQQQNGNFDIRYPNQEYNPADANQNRRFPDDIHRLQYGHDGEINLPGVLKSWRPDLQGKQRAESLVLERDVFVTTPYGQVQGFKVHLYDNPLPSSGYRPDLVILEKVQNTVSVFLGIPYALPPVNEARFKPPKAHPSWHSWHAVDYRPICPQPIKTIETANNRAAEMDEDCLYLNIFSPTTKSGIGKLFPVMVYIHGGDFIRGSSNSFPGHMMAAYYDVIVVTFNYRLGALGFLSTGDYNSPGNYGILDQIMALRWVYDNIENFNGDRNSITLFGPDAGAASAGLLMVNRRTRHIVSKVIAQSGSGVADWALIQDRWRAQNTSKVFGRHLGCSIESSWKLVDCLKRGRSFLELGNIDFKPEIGLFPWGPVLDTNVTMPGDNWFEGWSLGDWFFTNDTVESFIKAGSFNKNLVYMSGVTTQEAAIMIYKNDSLKPSYEISESFMDKKIKEFVQQYNYTLNQKGIYDAIKYMYTYWPDVNCKECVRTQYTNMLSDFLYVAPHDKIAKLLIEKEVPVYLYVQNTTVEALKLPEWCKAHHNIEQYFLIGAPFLDTEMVPMREKIAKHEWTLNDRNMSHFFMKAYTNFAKYGNPTYTQILGIHFDRAVRGQLFYLNINTTYNSSILFNYRQTESAFWTNYIPVIVGNLVPLYPPYNDLWWLQNSPIHVAFWSVSVLCMLLLAIAVILCMLWISSKREADHYYNEEFLSLEKEMELQQQGIENHTHSTSNIYEYRDAPKARSQSGKTASTASVRTDSVGSLREISSSSPRPAPRTKLPKTTELKDGIPQTAV